MAQGSLKVTDSNGVIQSLEETVLPDGNFAPNICITDPNGNRPNLAPGAVSLAVSQDNTKATYTYSALGYTPVATPTDVVEIQGSATKTLRIRRIKVGGVATAAGNMPVQLVRRSSADTTSLVRTALTAFKHDTTDGAATAVVSTIGTANPGVLGTQVGGLGGAGRAQLPASGSGVAANPLEWNFSRDGVKSCVLRGIADFLYLNLNGAALPAGAVFDLEIVIEEDGS
jgi:hypothetical protein